MIKDIIVGFLRINHPKKYVEDTFHELYLFRQANQSFVGKSI